MIGARGGCETNCHSTRCVKDGLLLDMAADNEVGSGHAARQQVWESANTAGQKYQFDASTPG